MSQEIESIPCDINPPGMHTPRRERQLRCCAAARKVRFAPLMIEGAGRVEVRLRTLFLRIVKLLTKGHEKYILMFSEEMLILFI